ncbi:MAG: carbohydrate binding family 9 domain-containing protein [Saprospiraceae bacterium]
MRRILYLFFLLVAYQAIGQQTRSYPIQKLEQAPNIDGEIESMWNQLPVASDFITSQPIFGKKPSGSTQFRMGYTDLALFILVECNSKFVRADGTQRDELGTGEWISLAFDTWNDQQNSLVFYVAASGAQTDAKHGLDGLATGFDAVWQSEVIKTSDGWLAEIRIPFVSLRFPVLEEHTWGLQVQRYNTDQGELSSWSPQDPLVSDWERQYGELNGLSNIGQETRHQLVWYTNYDQYKFETAFNRNRSFNTGMDARLGWRSNSSLDMSHYYPVFHPYLKPVAA